jgi:hypothetical protein
MSAPVLAVLERVGIDQEHLRALLMLPLVEVAWADGEIAPAEAALLRKLAQINCPGEEERLLLEDWLRHRPSPACLHHARVALWYLARHPDPALPLPLITRLPQQARKVASADSGWFRKQAVCPEERLVLERLSRALDDETPIVAEPPAHPDLERRMPWVTLVEEFGPERDPHPAVLVPERAGHRRERLQAEGTLLGSGPGAQCRVVGDDEMAASHGQLLRQEDRWRVIALEGPVWVNGERVQCRPLRGGELVRLSSRTAFWFKRLRPAPPPAPREDPRRARALSR